MSSPQHRVKFSEPSIFSGTSNIEQEEQSCITGYVWLDGNRNGLREPIEKGVGKVLVKIYDFAGRQSGTDITDLSGYFIFSDLPYGQYHVEFIQPVGFDFPAESAAEEEGWTLVNTMNCEADSNYLTTPLVTTANSGPTIVALETFKAEPYYGDSSHIEIEWTTSAEIDTKGFYLYRSIDSGYREEAARATPQMIPALGNPQGVHNRYTFTDTNFFADSIVYTYWLVEEETNGNLNEYGPIHIKHLVSASSSGTESDSDQNMIYLPLIEN